MAAPEKNRGCHKFFLIQDRKTEIFFVAASGRIPFCTVDFFAGKVINYRPYRVFPCGSVVLAKEARFSG